jgi:hypothetical protein
VVFTKLKSPKRAKGSNQIKGVHHLTLEACTLLFIEGAFHAFQSG